MTTKKLRLSSLTTPLLLPAAILRLVFSSLAIADRYRSAAFVCKVWGIVSKPTHDRGLAYFLCAEEWSENENKKTQMEEFYKKAMRMGHIKSMLRLGTFGVFIDSEQVRLLTAASDLGDVEAQVYLGRYKIWSIYSSPPDEAKLQVQDGIQLLMSSSSNGNADAMYELCRYYEYEHKLHVAHDWAHKAALLNHSDAQAVVASHHYYGYAGLDKNAKVAFQWAMKSDSAVAMLLRGRCYQKGLGVDQDLDVALKYYQQASFYGEPYLGLARYLAKDYAGAMDYWQKEVGSELSFIGIGNCYWYGLGVEKNPYYAITAWMSAESMRRNILLFPSFLPLTQPLDDNIYHILGGKACDKLAMAYLHFHHLNQWIIFEKVQDCMNSVGWEMDTLYGALKHQAEQMEAEPNDELPFYHLHFRFLALTMRVQGESQILIHNEICHFYNGEDGNNTLLSEEEMTNYD